MVIHITICERNPFAVVADFANTKCCKKPEKMAETLANGYSSDSTPGELSTEYQHDRVRMVFKKSLHSCALDESSLSIGELH